MGDVLKCCSSSPRPGAPQWVRPLLVLRCTVSEGFFLCIDREPNHVLSSLEGYCELRDVISSLPLNLNSPIHRKMVILSVDTQRPSSLSWNYRNLPLCFFLKKVTLFVLHCFGRLKITSWSRSLTPSGKKKMNLEMCQPISWQNAFCSVGRALSKYWV